MQRYVPVKMLKKIKSLKSQVWIETVIYTLMALTIIGIVLGLVKPALDEQRDRAAIKQSIDSLNEIDNKISEVKYFPGNSRSFQIKISRGELIIDGERDSISILIQDSKYAPSEPGIIVNEGNIAENTTKDGKDYSVRLTLDYKDKLNLTYSGEDVTKVLNTAPTPYNLAAVNNGGDNLFNIDFL